MHNNLVNMSRFCVKTSFCFQKCKICTLPFSDTWCEIVYENTSVNILFIFCQPWFVTLYRGHLSLWLAFFPHFYLLKSVNYKAMSKYSSLIGQYSSQSFKKSRMEFYSINVHPSSLMDFDQSFLWSFTLSKFASKIWPSFLVQVNFDSVNGALVFYKHLLYWYVFQLWRSFLSDTVCLSVKDKYVSWYCMFYAPDRMIRGILFLSWLFVCLSVVNFNLGYSFWTVRDRDFIFGMHTPLMIPFQMTPRSLTLWPWLWPWSWK